MPNTTLRLLLLLTVLLSFPACQTARMQIPSPLDAAPALTVEGANPRRWNAPLRFGEWKTLEVKEGADWGWGLPILGVDVEYSWQPYRLVLGGGEDRVRAECITRSLLLSRKGLSVDPSLGRIPKLACAFRDAEGDGTLRLHTKPSMKVEGTLAYRGSEWTVRSVHRLEGSRIQSGDPAGWEILSGDRAVAAVETINRGRVWIDPTLDRASRDRLAAVAASLLLYTPQDE